MPSESGFRYIAAPRPQNVSSDQLLLWALQEIENLSIVLNNVAAGHCDTLHVAPDKPRAGMIRYADGTNWNPGAGAGFYGYNGSAWVKLG